MRRDMDLIREILFEIEKLPYDEFWHEIILTDWTPEEVCGHAKLAADEGLIEAKFHAGSTAFVVQRLTNSGHDFVEAARHDTTWNKAKTMILSNGGALTVAALKGALTLLMQRAIA